LLLFTVSEEGRRGARGYKLISVKNGKVNKKIKQKSPIGSGWKGESLRGNELS
jgi:hypothetical protein